MDLHIDPELQAVIPPPTDQERAQLEANLLADGCRDPLVVWAGEPPAQVCPSCPPGTPFGRATTLIEAREGSVVWLCGFCDHGEQRPWTLLDGHTRYTSCQARRIPFTVVEAPSWVRTREDAKVWMIQNQLARRNLEPYQRAELALKLEPLIAVKAKEHQQQAGGTVPQKVAEAVDTRETLAQMAHVSHETMRKAKVIAQEADEPTKEALRRGERTIHGVYQELRQPRTASNGKAGVEASSGVPTPAAGRGTKPLTGAMWHERLVKVRQHVAQLQRSHLAENLVRTWALDVANGYREELAHLIEELRQVLQRIDVVLCAHVDGNPQFLMARRLIELADSIQHELATWRQQFPEDPSLHAFGLMEKHLRELRDYFRMKQRERTEHGVSIEVPTAGAAAGTLLEAPTKGDEMDQALSREDGPDEATDAQADAPTGTDATDESPLKKAVLVSCRTRQEARIAAHLWREKGRTVRVVHGSNDAAEPERPWHVIEVPTDGDSAGTLSEAPTTADDAMEQVPVADPMPHNTEITKRPHTKKQAKRARAKTSPLRGEGSTPLDSSIHRIM
jgi:hypothetical protein